LAGAARFMPPAEGWVSRLVGGVIFLASAAGPSPAQADMWRQLQFRVPVPIPYLVDVDGLQISGARRSLPAKWNLAADIYQLGNWAFDCRSRTWRSGGAFTISERVQHRARCHFPKFGEPL
jgi:hypothetical protein